MSKKDEEESNWNQPGKKVVLGFGIVFGIIMVGVLFIIIYANVKEFKERRSQNNAAIV